MKTIDEKTRNQDYLQAIKQKYVANRSTSRNSPSRYASRTDSITTSTPNASQTITRRQSVSPLQQKNMNYGEMYQSTFKSKVQDHLREYQSVKPTQTNYDRGYQQRTHNRQSVQQSNVKDEKYSVYLAKDSLKENQGKVTTSSPIKHFYQGSSKKETQIQKANQAKIEREKTATVIKNVESLLDTIRKTLTDGSRQ